LEEGDGSKEYEGDWEDGLKFLLINSVCDLMVSIWIDMDMVFCMKKGKRNMKERFIFHIFLDFICWIVVLDDQIYFFMFLV